jgi:ABC-type sugar transport system substrate-binding protein
MALKYNIEQLFKGKFPNAQNLYDQLRDIDRQIQEGADAVPIVKHDVKLTKTALKKAFGKDFNNIGVVHNEEGSYLIVADGDKFKHIALEDI